MTQEFTKEQHGNLTVEDLVRAANSMKGDIVIHFKGDKYLVLDVAQSATVPGSYSVIYKALYGDCSVYHRNVVDFFAWVADREDNVAGNKMRMEPIVINSVKERSNNEKSKND